MKHWIKTAREALSASLTPTPHELNELDWKAGLSPNRDQLAKHLSAFGNYPNGGFLVFGIHDCTGIPAGIEAPLINSIVGKLASLGRDALEPSLAIDHAVLDYQDSSLLFIHIPEQSVKPVHLRGKSIEHAYVRSGGTTRKASRQEIGTLLLNSQNPRWEELRASRLLSAKDVLSRIDVAAICALLPRPEPPSAEEAVEWLVNEKLVLRDGDGYCITNFGAMAGARDLRHFNTLERKRIRVVRYQALNKTEAIGEVVIDKGYAVGFEGLIDHLKQILPHSEVIQKALRREATVYPEIALRELIANALIHQDFTVTGAGPMIGIFSDRIEFTNPGRLLPSKKPDRLIGTSPESRNEVLASAFRRYWICEERGSGFQKVITSIELFGLPPVRFQEGENAFTVTLFAPRKFSQMSQAERIEACYTGDNYNQRDPTSGLLFGGVRINIFNISKINSEVRGGRAPRIKRLSEYIGESYFDYLAGLDDLVLLMDESHRYRASAGVRAINELKPVIGLELSATPFVETSKGPVGFKNVIYHYPLGKAMADGFVKEPAVVTRKDFNPAGMSAGEIERLKLEDGIRLHESVKVEQETYARQTGNHVVKPFLLIIARDTTHAGQLMDLIQSEHFFDARYKDKVIQVDSSRTGTAEDEMVQRLLAVESTEEPTEIVIHVNMLKEGWDVTNLYTIVPLRAANARILIEQSIGRGLRLPYGKRTGVTTVDRLNIIAHDRFQEIIDEASRPDSTIRLQQVVLNSDDLTQKTKTVVSQSILAAKLGLQPEHATVNTEVAGTKEPPPFATPEEQQLAKITYAVIRKLESQPQMLPSVAYLQKPEVQALMVKEVASQYRPAQMDMEQVIAQPDIAAVVAKTAELVIQQTIDIPRVLVVPKGEVRAGFKPFYTRSQRAQLSGAFRRALDSTPAH